MRSPQQQRGWWGKPPPQPSPASGGGVKRRPFLTFRPVGFQKPGGLFLCRTSTLGLQRREQGAARDGGRRDHHLHLRRRPVLSDVLSAAEGRSRRNGARVKKVDSSSGTTYYVGGLYEKMEAGGVVTTTSYYYAPSAGSGQAGQRLALRSRAAMRTTVGVSTTVTYLHGDHGSSPFGELLGSLAAPNCTWAPPA